MKSPKDVFEEKYGKKEKSNPEEWQKKFSIFLTGWMAGFDYRKESEKQEDTRSMLDL